MDSPGLFIDICDFDSGSPVEGARLSVYRAAEQEGIFVRTGDAIEQWVSEGEPHKLAEGLIPGEMYFFMEEEKSGAAARIYSESKRQYLYDYEWCRQMQLF